MAFSSSSLQAQTATPKVSKRQVHQQKRIHKGVKSGEVTGKEYVALQKQQRNVRRHKRAAKADGKVSRRERARLHAHQTKASANIYRAKHNKRKRK
ncbi:MAG: hypothetical protein D6730_18680 [Bacteroidetes bacterium]|nr:MAG: hypothetical protein D6730_18680 [Bacteroidota bacterium]